LPRLFPSPLRRLICVCKFPGVGTKHQQTTPTNCPPDSPEASYIPLSCPVFSLRISTDYLRTSPRPKNESSFSFLRYVAPFSGIDAHLFCRHVMIPKNRPSPQALFVKPLYGSAPYVFESLAPFFSTFEFLRRLLGRTRIEPFPPSLFRTLLAAYHWPSSGSLFLPPALPLYSLFSLASFLDGILPLSRYTLF